MWQRFLRWLRGDEFGVPSAREMKENTRVVAQTPEGFLVHGTFVGVAPGHRYEVQVDGVSNRTFTFSEVILETA